jgi:ribosomal-protein-alanine N-acetyltransferase
LALNLRLMREEDIPQVAEIDRAAFPTLWPPINYQRELENRLAHYIVACDDEEMIEAPEVKAAPQKGFAGMISRLKSFFGNGSPPPARQYIFGFAGLWLMAGEAHITNIAVWEKHRRQGIGEALLIAMIELAIELDARLITLEVRASNTAAQSLYAKYGFTQVGVRRGYYTDNREDGILMSLQDITSATVQANLQQLKQAHSQKNSVSSYSLSL